MRYRRFIIPLIVSGLWISSARTGAGEPEPGEKPARLRWIIFTPVDVASPEETSPTFRPRLSAGPDATVLLDGKPFRGIGVNYLDCFLRALHDGTDTSYDAGFATLAAKGIPFARFAATGFWPREMNLYVENREARRGLGCADTLRRSSRVTGDRPRFGCGRWAMNTHWPPSQNTKSRWPHCGSSTISGSRNYAITATNARSWQLQAIADANALLRETRFAESKP